MRQNYVGGFERRIKSPTNFNQIGRISTDKTPMGGSLQPMVRVKKTQTGAYARVLKYPDVL